MKQTKKLQDFSKEVKQLTKKQMNEVKGGATSYDIVIVWGVEVEPDNNVES